MKHKKNKKKLSRRISHRISLLRNLCKALINCEQITTTLAKAKAMQGIVERLITVGKKNSLHSRRRLISKLAGSLKEVDKILYILSPRYKEVKGGYTRILKCGFRKGDSAPMAVIQFLI